MRTLDIRQRSVHERVSPSARWSIHLMPQQKVRRQCTFKVLVYFKAAAEFMPQPVDDKVAVQAVHCSDRKAGNY